MNSSEKTKYILENNNFMVISTADTSGKPWVSPVGFVYDDSYNLYWVSSKQALHSKNITSRPEVAIVIFGQMPERDFDGVYIDARAIVLEAEVEIQAAIDLFTARRPQPAKFAVQSISDVTGDAAWRMYKASPIEISKRSNSTAHNQAISVREIIR